MLPSTTIDTRASNVTGLTVKGGGRCRQLYKDGQRVESKSLVQTCLDFVAWLQREVGEPALLVAHNCFSFDMRVMINQFQLCEKLDELKLVVAGFADTLPALRKALPKRKSYSQPSLFADILGGEYDAHDAVADVLALEKLVAKTLNIPRLFESSASFQSAVDYNTGLCQSSKVAAALRRRISKDHLSASMADKIAKSGLLYHDLELAFQRKGADGLHLLLTEKNDNGKVRVTHSKAVVSKLCEFFASVQLQKAGDLDNAKQKPDVPENHSSSLSEEKLALYRKRQREGYDLPDPEYLSWLHGQGVHHKSWSQWSVSTVKTQTSSYFVDYQWTDHVYT